MKMDVSSQSRMSLSDTDTETVEISESSDETDCEEKHYFCKYGSVSALYLGT